VALLEADGTGHWLVDGEPAPHLDGCRDVDLQAPAMTSALPVRRMGLPVAARGAGSRYILGLVNAERWVATGGIRLAYQISGPRRSADGAAARPRRAGRELGAGGGLLR